MQKSHFSRVEWIIYLIFAVMIYTQPESLELEANYIFQAKFDLDLCKLNRWIEANPSAGLKFIHLTFTSDLVAKSLARVQNLAHVECTFPDGGESLVDAILEQRNSLSLTLANTLEKSQQQRLLRSLSLMDDCMQCVQILELEDGSLDVDVLARVPVRTLTLRLQTYQTKCFESLTENRGNPSGPKHFKLVLCASMSPSDCKLEGHPNLVSVRSTTASARVSSRTPV